MKTVLVAGDLVWDFNLVRRDVPQRSYGEPIGHTVMSCSPGGAWFLEQMVRLALRDVLTKPEPSASNDSTKDATLQRRAYAAVDGVQVIGPAWAAPEWNIKAGQFAGGGAPAFTVWQQYPRKRRPPEKDSTAWCVAEFLGCQQPSKGTGDAASSSTETDSEPVDLLMLDDLGLDFRMDSKLWPRCLLDSRANRIVLKLNKLSETNPLLKKLLEDHADRLTIIVDADELRGRGANLSRGLSWELIREELIHELTDGRSQVDLALARRVIVPFSLDAVASFTRCDRNLGPPGSDPERSLPYSDNSACGCVRPRVLFERLLYVPDAVEGAFRSDRPGRMFGAASILTAAVARFELSPETYPLFIALARGMRAARESHDAGIIVDAAGSSASGCQLNEKRILAALHPEWTFNPPPTPDPNYPNKKPQRKSEPADTFKTAFPRYVLANRGQDAEGGKSTNDTGDLLHDVAGPGVEAITALAMSVVLQGPSAALDVAPQARLGDFVTVDREEIERLNALRNLFATYLADTKQPRPLSIVVFGQPGSGKSFAVKQLAKVVFPDKPEVLEFNLAQFSNDTSQLHGAFHRVRDAAVKGQVPLVFWDEFDCDRLTWLKHFLAPMQDGEFRSGEVVHPFGRCIFVFAGGTAYSLDKFIADWEKSQEFRDLKGPDFISRLGGYLNIKGPNPNDNQPIDKTADPAFIIRRAVLLRSMLERFHGRLIDSQKQARVSNGVVRALLRVETYRHGARSLESVLRMCRLQDAESFGPAQLATRDLLSLHVSDEFLGIVTEGEVEAPVIEAMAQAIHEAWLAERERNDWKFGEPRDDFRKLHPMIKPYAELSESDKERNRRPARLFRAKLAEVGFTVVFKPGAEQKPLEEEVRQVMIRSEHDRWLRERLFYGTQWAPKTCEDLKLHCDVASFDDLDRREQSLDAQIVDAIPRTLHRFGYTIERMQQPN